MRLNGLFKSKTPETPRIDKSKIGNPTDLRKMGQEEPAGPGKAGVGLNGGQAFPRFQQGGQMEFLAGRLPGEAGSAKPTNTHMKSPEQPGLPPGIGAKPDTLRYATGGIPSRDSMPWQSDKLPDVGLAENMPKLPGSGRPSAPHGLPEGWTVTPFEWNGSKPNLE